MALVAYGSSEESDVSDPEEEKGTIGTSVLVSDDEGENKLIVKSILDEENQLGDHRSLPLSLPRPAETLTTSLNGSKLVDENEDLSTIPEHKVYLKSSEASDTRLATERKREKESIWSTKAKLSKRRGPVRIMAPSLVTDLDCDEKGAGEKPTASSIAPKIAFDQNAKAELTHSLFSVLPRPKNSPALSSSSVSINPSLSSSSSLVPRSVSRKFVRKEAEKAGADDDDENAAGPSSFFNLQDKPVAKPNLSLRSTLAIIAKPDVIDPVDGFFSSTSSQHVGPAAAPYPPTASGYDNADDLLANREAIERIQGKQKNRSKAQEELSNVVDVNASDLTADPMEWMTKALTEEQNVPGPRCTVKGQTKRKHQITYLAALAKEREQDLKQQWSENAHKRRQAGNKYGF